MSRRALVASGVAAASALALTLLFVSCPLHDVGRSAPLLLPPAVDQVEVVLRLEGLVRRCQRWEVRETAVVLSCGDETDSAIVVRELRSGGRVTVTRVRVAPPLLGTTGTTSSSRGP